MGDEQNGLAPAFELAELIQALVREPFVAHRQHFVYEQHVWIDVYGHRKTESHVHPGGIRFHRRVDELLQLGKLHDLVEAPGHFALGEPEHDAVDEDVFAPGDLGMETGAQFDERRDAAPQRHSTRRGPGDAGHQLQRGALARPVAADDAVGLPRRHVERHALQCRKFLFRLQILDKAALQQGALERRELLAPRIAAIDLRDVDELDGVHTSSANESRSRSNRKYPNRNSSAEAKPRPMSHFQWPKSPGKYRIS